MLFPSLTAADVRHFFKERDSAYIILLNHVRLTTRPSCDFLIRECSKSHNIEADLYINWSLY